MEENKNINQNNNSMDEVKSDAGKPVFPTSSSVPINNEYGQTQRNTEIQIPNDDLHVEFARQAAASAIKDEPAKSAEEPIFASAITETPADDKVMVGKESETVLPKDEETKEDSVFVETPVEKELKLEEDLGAGKIAVITKILEQVAREIEQIKKLMATSENTDIGRELMTLPEISTKENPIESQESNVVEGVFDGESMIGSDGKKYDVPPNYASKSKLVEGDILKLTITGEGSFLFKQIGPIERNRIVGMLTYEPVAGRYVVVADGKKWLVLTASVTYFRGKPGDEAVILVPKNAPSQWAAVENIIGRKNF